MTRLVKKCWLLWLGIGMVATVWLLAWIDQREVLTTTPTEPLRQPEYVMRHFKLVELDHQGAPLRWLSADVLEHFPNAITELEKPWLRIKSTTGEMWVVTADKGSIYNEKEITLRDNVVVARSTNDRLQDTLAIYTEALNFSLENNVGETDNPVIITSGSHQVEAVGMKVLVNDQRLKLKSRVRGQYIVRDHPL